MELKRGSVMLREELRDKTELRTEVIGENEHRPEPKMNREQLNELKHLITNLRKGKGALTKLLLYR